MLKPSPAYKRSKLGRAIVSECKRFYSRRLWRKDVKIVPYNGLSWLLDRRNRVDRKVICTGYEEPQIDFLLSQLRTGTPCDYFFDIGANFGLYTMQMAASGMVRQVVAFEPDSRNYAQLQANLYLNGLSATVRAHHCAVSDTNAPVLFEIYPEASTGQSRISTTGEGKTTTTVDAITLDGMFAALSGKKIAMKIDVEGHEIQALRGAEHVLRHNGCLLQIEAWPENSEALKSHMQGLGYNCIQLINEDHYFANEAFLRSQNA